MEKVLNGGLIAGINVVGAKFMANEFYVSEVLIAARAMKSGSEINAFYLNRCLCLCYIILSFPGQFYMDSGRWRTFGGLDCSLFWIIIKTARKRY